MHSAELTSQDSAITMDSISNLATAPFQPRLNSPCHVVQIEHQLQRGLRRLLPQLETVGKSARANVAGGVEVNVAQE